MRFGRPLPLVHRSFILAVLNLFALAFFTIASEVVIGASINNVFCRLVIETANGNNKTADENIFQETLKWEK
jgi:hypothetical protein